jgi:phosphatidylglycerol:prolipoprotein diacylglycerol transferase
MFPVLFHIGSLAVPTYGITIAIAYLVAAWYLRKKALAEGLPEQKVFDLSIAILASAILGAKLLLVITDWKLYWHDPKELVNVLRSAGVFYGGLICASIVGIWYLIRHRLPPWKVADMGAPAIALGEGIGRWGCFAAGCCFGKDTSGPFGVVFKNPIAHEQTGVPLGHAIEPTQIYLSLNAFAIFLFLHWLYKRKSFDGEIFCTYLLLYAITRGILEIWRGDSVRGFVIPNVLSTSQLIGVLVAVAAIAMLFALSRRHRRSVEA